MKGGICKLFLTMIASHSSHTVKGYAWCIMAHVLEFKNNMSNRINKSVTEASSGVALTQKKLRFLCKKGAGYANLKMLCIFSTQKTVTSHIKMHLVFSFFAPSKEGLQSTCRGYKHLRFPAPSPLPSPSHPGEGMLVPTWGCSWHL